MKRRLEAHISEHPLIAVAVSCVAVLTVVIPVLEWANGIRRDRIAGRYEVTIAEQRLKIVSLEQENARLSSKATGSAIPASDYEPGGSNAPATDEAAKSDGAPDGNEKGPSIGQNSQAGNAESVLAVHEMSGFQISFLGCGDSGGGSLCKFRIQNNGQKRKLAIAGSGAMNGAGVIIGQYSRMIGPDGSEYRASWVEVGNADRANVRAVSEIFPGVATTARVGFEGLPTGLLKVPVLLVAFGGSELQFKDVAIR